MYIVKLILLLEYPLDNIQISFLYKKCLQNLDALEKKLLLKVLSIRTSNFSSIFLKNFFLLRIHCCLVI